MEVSDAVSEGEGGGSLRDWRLSGLRTSWEGEETGAEWDMALLQSVGRQKTAKCYQALGYTQRQTRAGKLLLTGAIGAWWEKEREREQFPLL